MMGLRVVVGWMVRLIVGVGMVVIEGNGEWVGLGGVWVFLMMMGGGVGWGM